MCNNATSCQKIRQTTFYYCSIHWYGMNFSEKKNNQLYEEVKTHNHISCALVSFSLCLWWKRFSRVFATPFAPKKIRFVVCAECISTNIQIFSDSVIAFGEHNKFVLDLTLFHCAIVWTMLCVNMVHKPIPFSVSFHMVLSISFKVFFFGFSSRLCGFELLLDRVRHQA